MTRSRLTESSRTLALLVYPGFQFLDLAGPLAAFESANSHASGAPYRTRIVSVGGGLIASTIGVDVASEKIGRKPVDTLIIVGGSIDAIERQRQSHVLSKSVAKSAASARRVASVCTGAFVLAEAGLLQGRAATTHWKYARMLQSLYPEVRVNGDRIYTKDGRIWTSAGISAGIDLSIALIEEDLGTDVARATAQDLVVYHRRPGGQTQFSALLEMEPETDRLRGVITHIRNNLRSNLTVEDLAKVAGISVRQFGRIFLAETGETPAKAIERIRAEAARPRIENSSEPIETVAELVGFNDPERMRRAFLRIFGHPPQALRRLASTAR